MFPSLTHTHANDFQIYPPSELIHIFKYTLLGIHILKLRN